LIEPLADGEKIFYLQETHFVFTMLERIEQLKKEFFQELTTVTDTNSLETFRIKYLARKGLLSTLFDDLKNVPPSEKPVAGKSLNELRKDAQEAYEAKKKELEQSLPGKGDVSIDITLPGRPKPTGTLHPITQTIDEIKKIFLRMGFAIATGPEVETDYYNFQALNFPPDHPARDMQDTFFLSKSKNVLLRTHTSPVQIRTMERQKPPVRVIIPGRVYRNETLSARSSFLFHQIEGLYVDKGVAFSDLKGTLVAFAKQFYGSDVKYKFRPTFFPFTEPSADMYISCFICSGKGCRVCKYVGWLEILGSGMVHPHLYKYVGYDAEKYSGFAFGMGIERIAMLRYGIDDIRLFYQNDVRFLKQF
jgi:phenylalanyl-tRNA synthetase alpha chain